MAAAGSFPAPRLCGADPSRSEGAREGGGARFCGATQGLTAPDPLARSIWRCDCPRLREGWPSGLRRAPGERVHGRPCRGFESHSLRQINPGILSRFNRLDLPQRTAERVVLHFPVAPGAPRGAAMALRRVHVWNRDGRYYWRVRLPVVLARRLGRTHYGVALRTSDRGLARRLAARANQVRSCCLPSPLPAWARRAGGGRLSGLRTHYSLDATRHWTAWPDHRAATVIALEHAFAAIGSPGVLLYPTMTCGAGGENTVRRIAALTRFGLVPLSRGGRSLIQPVHIEDVARAVVSAVQRRFYHAEPIVLAGPEPVSYAAFVRAVATAAGRRAAILPVPLGVASALGAIISTLPRLPRVRRAEIRRLVEDKAFDITPARELLGFDAMPLTEGLARTFARGGRSGLVQRLARPVRTPGPAPGGGLSGTRNCLGRSDGVCSAHPPRTQGRGATPRSPRKRRRTHPRHVDRCPRGWNARAHHAGCARQG